MVHWKIHQEETVFRADPYVRVVRQELTTDKGVTVPDFYQVLLRPFAICIPLTNAERILAIRQYKHGPGKVSLTFPAGFIEDNERAEDACERELLEETGFRAGTLQKLGQFVDNGNQRGCLGTYFVVTDCEKIKAEKSGDLETMEVIELTVPEIDKELENGNLSISHNALAWLLARPHVTRLLE